MAKPLRYTGCWPPVEILDEYPNWVFATDEESEPDQDETTIRPENQQSFISSETDYTAATVTLANGTRTRGILSFLDGKLDTLDVFDGRDWWRVTNDLEQRRWSPYVENWLPQQQRRPTVSLADADIFPVHVETRLLQPVGMFLLRLRFRFRRIRRPRRRSHGIASGSSFTDGERYVALPVN
jgi:hypothetical protein